MPTQQQKADQFRARHEGDRPLLLPNPWDRGTALIMASLGFEALATTSSGFAATLGRADGEMTRDEALVHATEIVEATDLPVSADLENGFGDEPADVAETALAAVGTGLAGFSIEDFAGTDDRIYDLQLAEARVEAAAEIAHRGPARLVLTARAENHIRGRADLPNTISRLQAFQNAGADVVYAPGLADPDDIGRVVSSVDLPVNVLSLPTGPTVRELAELGVSRVSVGGAFSLVAHGALVDAARAFQAGEEPGYWELVAEGRAAREAFGRSTGPTT